VESSSRSERVRKTWQNPDRRTKQTIALKKCWQRPDYRAKLTDHLRRIAPKGNQAVAKIRASGGMVVSKETRKRQSESQRKRFQRPEEVKKLEAARQLSFQVIDFQERARTMQKAFLAKYGSFMELARMGNSSPNRKPNKLEIKMAKMLGDEWEYVGDGKLVVGGLIPDFVRKGRKEILEVLGCYYHSCPEHHPNGRLERTASLEYRESVYKRNGYAVRFIWEHEIRRLSAFNDSRVDDPLIYAS
jgi:hypothetical protein